MISHIKAISVRKPEKGNLICEDAAIACGNRIVISDGAGGGGVFADQWAQYLVDSIGEKPITTFEEFNAWMDVIWEPFYYEHESMAQKQGGMLLNKFYDEGSFATLVAAWRIGNTVKWIAYGDSVVFMYDRKTKELKHSFSSLADFAQPPHLINCKEEVNPDGFSAGVFDVDSLSYVFACSDALAHYVMMMYEVSAGKEIAVTDDKNSDFVSLAKTKKVDFEKKVLKPLFNSLRDGRLHEHCIGLYSRKLLGLDDYSLARLM